jgi:hypothetical protein
MADKISPNDMSTDITPTPAPTPAMDDDSEDIDIVMSDEPESNMDVKLLYSKATGKPNLISVINGKPVEVNEVPPQYMELAKMNPRLAFNKIKADKTSSMSSDDSLMESVRRDIENEIKRLRK